MEVKIRKQKLDLVELDLANKQVHVVDPSFAWADPWHNLKSQVYLYSLNPLCGGRAAPRSMWDTGCFRTECSSARPSDGQYLLGQRPLGHGMAY
jgi:hypothetical protein